MNKRVAIAKYIESCITLGRTPIQALAGLGTDELNIVVNEFLRNSGTQYVVKLRMKTWTSKVDRIKQVRAITNCGLVEAKNFVEGCGDLTVTDHQKNELARVFLNNLIVNGH
jgi:ribosomal protein L7/L12